MSSRRMLDRMYCPGEFYYIGQMWDEILDQECVLHSPIGTGAMASKTDLFFKNYENQLCPDYSSFWVSR